MRRLHKSLSLIFLAIFISASFVFVPQSHAVDPIFFPGIPGVTQPKTMQDYAKEFCDKRSGELMNLETWYSGKCATGVDTLSGEGVGFVDIVILQGIEWVNTLMLGSPQDNFIDSVTKQIMLLKAFKDKITTGQINASQVDLASINGGGIVPSIVGLTGKLITTKPASSIDYLAYVSSNLKSHHVINEAFAASSPGYGFQALAPILPLWRAFRNIAYLLFALGFVLYGVMIMFRIKIDAKTAASVQLAIPKLIVTLLIITFSYAIVGFLIDISTVITAMMISVLRVGGIISFDVHPLINMASGKFLGAIGSFIVNVISAMIVAPFIFFNLLIGGIIGIVITVFADIVGTVSGIGILVSVVIFLAVGFSYVKLIFKLFQAYFSIIINLIFSPVILLGNLIPGSGSIGTWIMSIVGNLAVFPVASFFLVLSYALMVQPILSIFPNWIPGLGDTNLLETILGVKSLSTLNNIWTPPLTIGAGLMSSNPNPIFGSSLGSLMLATIGFGLLMMASKYCEMVEKALKTPPFPYGAAIGEALRYGYNQAGDPDSGWRKSRLGDSLNTKAQRRYDTWVNGPLGRPNNGTISPFDDVSGPLGKPKA